MNQSKNTPAHIAEIIQSTLTEFAAQCWKFDQAPHFGSLVAIESTNGTMIAIVHAIKTESIDPTGTKQVYQKTEEQLLRDQPELFHFLKTTFTASHLGLIDKNKVFYTLPSTPAKMHAFVRPCSTYEYQQFFNHDQFLHLLINITTATVSIEELMLALLKELQQKNILQDQKMISLIETIANLYQHDYQKVKVFLNRAQYLFCQTKENQNV